MTVEALCQAANDKDLHTAQQLLNKSTNHVNDVPQEGEFAGKTPLYVAASVGDLLITQLLARHGAKIDQIINKKPGSKEQRSALFIAIENNHISTARFLIQELLKQGFNPNAPLLDDNGHQITPLMLSIQLGRTEIFQYLLNTNHVDAQAEFPDESPEAFRHLTPLAATVVFNQKALVEYLVEEKRVNMFHPMSNDAKPYASLSAINIAEQLHHDDILNYLHRRIFATVNVWKDTEEMKTLLALGDHKKIVRQLVRKKTVNKLTALKNAIEDGNKPLIELILSESKNKKLVNHHGIPLYRGLKSAIPGIVDFLIACGADVNNTLNHEKTKQDHGKSPLYYATEKKQTMTAINLISRGADVNFEYKRNEDEMGVSILEIAIMNSDTLLVDALVKNGAYVGDEHLNIADIIDNTQILKSLQSANRYKNKNKHLQRSHRAQNLNPSETPESSDTPQDTAAPQDSATLKSPALQQATAAKSSGATTMPASSLQSFFNARNKKTRPIPQSLLNYISKRASDTRTYRLSCFSCRCFSKWFGYTRKEKLLAAVWLTMRIHKGESIEIKDFNVQNFSLTALELKLFSERLGPETCNDLQNTIARYQQKALPEAYINKRIQACLKQGNLNKIYKYHYNNTHQRRQAQRPAGILRSMTVR